MKAVKYLFVLAIIVVACTGCASKDMVEQYMLNEKVSVDDVSFKLKQNPDRLEITSKPNSNCSGNQRLGCLFAGQGDINIARFSFKGNKQYYLHKLLICPGVTKQTSCTLTEAQGREFYVLDNRGLQAVGTDGEVIFPVGNKRVDFMLFNLNQDSGDYYYDIWACSDAEAKDCIALDPVIQNKGVGNFN